MAAPIARRIAAEDLNVAPWVQELPLAAPRRRFWAIAIDLVLVAIVSGILLPDRHADPDDEDDEPAAPARVVPAPRAASSMTAGEAIALAARVTAAAASAAQAAQAAQAAPPSSSGPASSVGTQGPAVDAADAALAEIPNDALVRQVHSLEKQLAEARRPKAWYERGWHWFRGLVTGYGGSLLYFTVVPAFWRGQTVGKRLLGLRIVEITGKPMTLRLAFSRYGGYVAGMVTGGFGLAQVMWDRNRQGLQDKVAHTVVVDERATAKASAR